MSFGFGVGDFLAVGRLVWDVYRAYAEAPEQFRSFSQEILALHAIVRKVEDQLGITNCDGAATGSQLPTIGSESSQLPPVGSGSQPAPVAALSTKDKDDLKILYDGLQAIMKELGDLLKKYKSLESSHNPIDRFKWGQEDLVGLRDKIRSNIAMVTVFNSTLANCQLAYQSAQLVRQNTQFLRLQEQLEQLLPIATRSIRRRVSVASLHSIASMALSIGQKKAWKEAWKELSNELHQNGITADTIKAKKGEICKLLRTASVISLSGKPDEGVLQNREGNQGKKIDRAPFDGMVEVLLLPATRAKYLVARLVGSKTASLHVAAANGRTNLVKVLLDKGAKIDALDGNEWTALHWAAQGGHTEAVKVLLDRGATIDATTDRKWTTLHVGANAGADHPEAAKVQLNRDSTMTKAPAHSTALHLAAKGAHIEVVKALLDRDANINASTCTDDSNCKESAIYWAIRGGHIEIVNALSMWYK